MWGLSSKGYHITPYSIVQIKQFSFFFWIPPVLTAVIWANQRVIRAQRSLRRAWIKGVLITAHATFKEISSYGCCIPPLGVALRVMGKCVQNLVLLPGCRNFAFLLRPLLNLPCLRQRERGARRRAPKADRAPFCIVGGVSVRAVFL